MHLLSSCRPAVRKPRTAASWSAPAKMGSPCCEEGTPGIGWAPSWDTRCAAVRVPLAGSMGTQPTELLHMTHGCTLAGTRGRLCMCTAIPAAEKLEGRSVKLCLPLFHDATFHDASLLMDVCKPCWEAQQAPAAWECTVHGCVTLACHLALQHLIAQAACQQTPSGGPGHPSTRTELRSPPCRPLCKALFKDMPSQRHV